MQRQEVNQQYVKHKIHQRMKNKWMDECTKGRIGYCVITAVNH